jgi:hypothetical protein
VKGLLADINALGPIEYLIQRMQAEPWADFWNGLRLVFKHFGEVGLSADSSDLIIWRTCQAEELVLITDNRNLDSSDSLEATIRQYNTPDSLPVFTIGDLDKFRTSRSYSDRVLEMLYEYLLRIDSVRGTGRLYLP